MPAPQKPLSNPIPFSVRKHAYQFDGIGNFKPKDWDLSEGVGSIFNWYHVELPRTHQNCSMQAQSLLVSVLCPPLKLHDILMLASNGPFCEYVNDALFFRVNSSELGWNDHTLRIAARVTDNCIITVSLERIPRLGFRRLRRKNPPSIIPSVEDDDDECFDVEVENDEEVGNDETVVINEKLLDLLLSMNHSEEADRNVANRVGSLLVHIVDAHVNQVQAMASKLEMEWKSVKLLLGRGDSMPKNENFDDTKCTIMQLNILRLVLIVEHGKQVFPRVKEICATKIWFTSEDAVAFEKLIRRLERLKGDLSFLATQVTAARVGFRSWLAKQINRKLYFLFFCSIVFLTWSIVTVFQMNGGGLPWTGQSDNYGFRKVVLLCVAIWCIFLLCFTLTTAWKRRRGLARR